MMLNVMVMTAAIIRHRLVRTDMTCNPMDTLFESWLLGVRVRVAPAPVFVCCVNCVLMYKIKHSFG